MFPPLESDDFPTNQNSFAPITESGTPDGDLINAEFIGGQEGLMRFLADNIKYPEAAAASKIQGKMIVSFKISAHGDVLSVAIEKPLDSNLDKEALRVCSMITEFKPATLNGSPIPATYHLPVTFRLQ